MPRSKQGSSKCKTCTSRIPITRSKTTKVSLMSSTILCPLSSHLLYTTGSVGLPANVKPRHSPSEGIASTTEYHHTHSSKDSTKWNMCTLTESLSSDEIHAFLESVFSDDKMVDTPKPNENNSKLQHDRFESMIDISEGKAYEHRDCPPDQVTSTAINCNLVQGSPTEQPSAGDNTYEERKTDDTAALTYKAKEVMNGSKQDLPRLLETSASNEECPIISPERQASTSSFGALDFDDLTESLSSFSIVDTEMGDDCMSIETNATDLQSLGSFLPDDVDWDNLSSFSDEILEDSHHNESVGIEYCTNPFDDTDEKITNDNMDSSDQVSSSVVKYTPVAASQESSVAGGNGVGEHELDESKLEGSFRACLTSIISTPKACKEKLNLVSEVDIKDDDILFERKEKGERHPGTVRFGRLVLKKRSDYETGDVQARARLVHSIVTELNVGNRRFIRKIGDGPYYVMTEEEVLTVVREALCNSNGPAPSSSSELPVPRSYHKNLDAVAEPPIPRVDSSTLPDTNAPFSPSDNCRIYVHEGNVTCKDVLCGRLCSGTSHPGTASYLRLVSDSMAKYQSLGRQHGKKTAIRNWIIDEILDRDGRFVRMTEDARFYLLTLQEVRNKVSQSLRDCARKGTR